MIMNVIGDALLATSLLGEFAVTAISQMPCCETIYARKDSISMRLVTYESNGNWRAGMSSRIRCCRFLNCRKSRWNPHDADRISNRQHHSIAARSTIAIRKSRAHAGKLKSITV